MSAFFRGLFGTDFMAHVYCLRDPSVIALHAICDGLIALSYFLIPVILVFLVRRREDLPFRMAYILFGLFILACGTTHMMAVVTLWHPVYRLEGVIKAITALASMGTAYLLVRVMPQAVSLPGPDQFRHEIAERQRAEEQVRTLNAELESKVRSRTLQLEDANKSLAERTLQLERANEALRTSEATARSLFENASQGILTSDHEGRILDANAMMEALFGYSRAELIGALLEMLLPENLRSLHTGLRTTYAMQPHARPMGIGMDLVGRRKNGSEFPVEIGLSHVTGQQSRLFVAFISDISPRKEASRERESLIARLESALAEKTVLLKEVHHRVKNNLAVIAGLLEMQADRLDDERAIVALGESQKRVLSMALIHEYLYSTEHLDRVNFGQYAEQLASGLCATYAIEPDLVSIGIAAKEIDLPVHRAIPCGLILNELLCNALKYAFPGGRRGKISVHFVRLPSGELSLSCRDDGVGIPESMDWKDSPSLGLRIVNILTKQIDGELTLDRSGGGTGFELRFPAAD